MLTKEDFTYIYEMLDQVTPLYGDCGELCEKLCCTDWEDGVGMYLIPGEEVMFTGNEDWLVFKKHATEDYEFPPSWEGEFTFVRCVKPCPRAQRPFECRTFPVIPYYDQESDSFELILHPDGTQVCPLAKYSNIDELNPEFIDVLQEAWSILLTDPLVEADIKYKSAIWDQDPPWKQFYSE